MLSVGRFWVISKVALGLEVPSPILPFNPSMENIGLDKGPEGVAVAKLKALTRFGRVLVAVVL